MPRNEQYNTHSTISALVPKSSGSIVTVGKNIRFEFERTGFESQLELKDFSPFMYSCTCISLHISYTSLWTGALPTNINFGG